MAVIENMVWVTPKESFVERYQLELFRFRKDEKRLCPESLAVRLSHLLTINKDKSEVK